MSVVYDGSLASSRSSKHRRGRTLAGMKPIQVRLMNDYSAWWPLWTDEDGGTDENDWELSPPLKRRLKTWAAFFDAHFHWEHGWDSSAACRQHRTEGVDLHQLLVAELGPGYDVILDSWETKNCSHGPEADNAAGQRRSAAP